MQKTMFRRLGLAFTLAALSCGLPALAQDGSFVASLTSLSSGAARCNATFSYDDLGRQLTYRLTCDDLPGSATYVHLFGSQPAPVDMMAEVNSTPIIGTASLTDNEVAVLKGGNMTVQVQTDRQPQGAVAGKISAR